MKYLNFTTWSQKPGGKEKYLFIANVKCFRWRSFWEQYLLNEQICFDSQCYFFLWEHACSKKIQSSAKLSIYIILKSKWKQIYDMTIQTSFGVEARYLHCFLCCSAILYSFIKYYFKYRNAYWYYIFFTMHSSIFLNYYWNTKNSYDCIHNL